MGQDKSIRAEHRLRHMHTHAHDQGGPAHARLERPARAVNAERCLLRFARRVWVCEVAAESKELRGAADGAHCRAKLPPTHLSTIGATGAGRPHFCVLQCHAVVPRARVGGHTQRAATWIKQGAKNVTCP